LIGLRLVIRQCRVRSGLPLRHGDTPVGPYLLTMGLGKAGVPALRALVLGRFSGHSRAFLETREAAEKGIRGSATGPVVWPINSMRDRSL